MLVWLLTAIEDAARFWETHPRAMRYIVPQCETTFATLVTEYGGCCLEPFRAAFDGGDPLACALAWQRWVAAQKWVALGDLQVAIAVASPVRGAAVLAAAWGGQILCMPEVLKVYPLPAGVTTITLGVHPLKDLGAPQLLSELRPSDWMVDFPPLRSLAAYSHNLPSNLLPLVARPELRKTLAALRDPEVRLVTLVGPGGIGKTRLALQAAAECIANYADGVYFVPLTFVGDAELIAPAIGAALKVTFQGQATPTEQLFNYLHARQILLVLDTFEHLLMATAWLYDLLDAAPILRLLITSHVPLDLPGEQVVRVSGFQLPDSQRPEQARDAPAVQCFVQSARRTRPDFVLLEADLPHIVRICQLVGGNPLAIELAAAWTHYLSCQEVAAEVARSLDFLETTIHDIPERHRSLRAMFDYSWRQLSPTEQQALCALAVFQGTFTASAAIHAAGLESDGLAQLCEKSWLRAEPGGDFVFQEALREYAAEQLREHPMLETQVRDRHCVWYAERLGALAADVKGPRLPAVLDEIQHNFDNILAAWEWAVQKAKAVELDAMVDALHRYGDVRGLQEQTERLFSRAEQRLRGLPSHVAVSLLRARLLGRQGWLRFMLARYPEAQTVLDESLVLLPSAATSERAFTMIALAYVNYYSLGNLARARELFTESFSLAEAVGDAWNAARALTGLGNLLDVLGEYAESLSLRQEALECYRRLGDPVGIAAASNNLANSLYIKGDYERMQVLHSEALALSELLGNRQSMARNLEGLGTIQHRLGNYIEAQSFYQRSLTLYRETGDRWGSAYILMILGLLAYDMHDYGAAQHYYQQSLALAEVLNQPYGIASARKGLGEVYLAQGKLAQAARAYEQALQLAVTSQHTTLIVAVLLAVAYLCAHYGSAELALGWMLFCGEHPASDQEMRQRAIGLRDELLRRLPEAVIAQQRTHAASMTLESCAAAALETLCHWPMEV